jgi:hypothetical protein
MKRKSGMLVALAILALAAAPPPEPSGKGQSGWSRLVEGAKSAIHLGRDEPRATKRRVDPAVRQATASQPRVSGAGSSSASTKRGGWFSRPQRQKRTLSEYMAQEKP